MLRPCLAGLLIVVCLGTLAELEAGEPAALRYDFESGDLQGWAVVEGELAAAVHDRAMFHNGKEAYNKQGTYFLTTLESGGEKSPPDDDQMAVVESPAFKLEGGAIRFLVGGGGHEETRVALLDAETNKPLFVARGENAEPMRRIAWDAAEFVGQQVVVQVVDRQQGSWGHITFDDFAAEGVVNEAATDKRREAHKQRRTELARGEWDVCHGFLAAGAETYIRTHDGKISWKWPGSTRDAWVLPNGNLLLVVSKGKKYPGGGVIEVTRDGEIVFEYVGKQVEVNSAEKLANGNYVITEAGPEPKLVELDAEGTVVVEFALACQKPNAHMQTRMARKLANGNYVAPHLLDFAVKEYTPEGKVVRTIPTDDRGREKHDWPFTAIRLENGNTLIGCTNGNRVIEVDTEGKIVWQLTNADLPAPLIADACGVQRLPNGNTVVASYHVGPNQTKLIEVTPEKKLVWTFQAPGPGIHHFQILDTDGKPLEGPALK